MSDEHLPTMHGFDEFFGNLYHLNAEEEPEHPDYPPEKDFPNYKKNFGPRGVLYRLDPDGTVTPQVRGVRISNGLAWSSDRRTMWFIDSFAWSVEAFDLDPATGDLAGGRRTVIGASSRDAS